MGQLVNSVQNEKMFLFFFLCRRLLSTQLFNLLELFYYILMYFDLLGA